MDMNEKITQLAKDLYMSALVEEKAHKTGGWMTVKEAAHFAVVFYQEIDNEIGDATHRYEAVHYDPSILKRAEKASDAKETIY